MSDDYSRAIARTAVAQLAELATYEAVQDSAADVLSELLIKYITELSSTAHGYAELANRTGVNVHDLLLSLDDLGTSVPELQSYLKELHPDANTFPHALPEYPVRRPARSMPTWHDKGEEPPPHIPSFLPAFPDKHTYMRTPTFPGHETQPDKQAQAQHKARKQAETALLNLHHATMAAAKQAAKQAADATATGQAAASSAPTGNPFLAQPEVVVLPPGQAGTAGGLIPGTGAYEPQMASKAFASVLAGAEGDGGADVGGDGVGDALEVKDEPMTDLNWKFQARMDAQGTLKQPLGTSTDYASTAFTAAHTYALGTADLDAYEEAAKGEAPVAGATGTVRKRKSTYGTVVDPLKRKAQDVMEKAKDPNPAAEGDE